MKKTYKNPVLEVIKIQTQQMLALSTTSINSNPVDAADAESQGTEFEW